MESYNLNDLKKSKLPPMRSKRKSFTPLGVGNYIYALAGAIGGYNGTSVLDACERWFRITRSDYIWLILIISRFDTVKRVWEPVQSMPTARCGYSAVELNGKIYVAGGHDGTNRFINSFYCYDPCNDSWLEKASLMANGKVWLGKSGESIYSINLNWNVQRYDTNPNIWTTVIVHWKFIQNSRVSNKMFLNFRLEFLEALEQSWQHALVSTKFTFWLKMERLEHWKLMTSATSSDWKRCRLQTTLI